MSNKILPSLIWSDTENAMIPQGFTTRAVLIRKDGSEPYKVCKSFHWTWHEDDAVYYRDDVDDSFRYEVPENGEKALSLKLGYKRRTLVTLD